jgi:16S rRNA (adenine1518-N6/adenine1519-N6)-dimethyltransferase
MSNEILDIVDTADQIVGKALRSEIYAKKLPHRIVHVLVRDSSGRIGLQRRSASVSYCPLYWSTTAGGHVLAGESYEAAAAREYTEELGVTCGELTCLGKTAYHAEGVPPKFLTVFETPFMVELQINPREVESVEFFTPAELRQMISQGEPLMAELIFVLEQFVL